MKRINEKTKKILYSLFAVGFIFLAVGVTYAFFNADFKGTYDNELAIGQNLIFRYDESEVGLNLTTDEILTDEDGITQDKYFDFEVGFESDTETSVNYYIYLTKDGTSTLEENNIKIYLTDQNDNSLVEPTKISKLVTHETYDNSRYLYGKKITSDNNVEEVNEYRIRVWAAETNQTITNTGDSHILEIAEQTYKFKVNVATGEMPEKSIQKDSSNANVPVLASNMIPVIYDSGNSTWVKADKYNTDLTWFNYTDKKWANAVTVEESGYVISNIESSKTVNVANQVIKKQIFTSDNVDIDNSTSTSTFTFTAKTSGTYSFDWSVSSEDDYDLLTITINGTTVVSEQSGVNSGTYTGNATSGTTYTIVANYTKDESGFANDDMATIGNFVLPSGTSLTHTPGQEYSWFEDIKYFYSLMMYENYSIDTGRFKLENGNKESNPIGKYICSDATSTTCDEIYKIVEYNDTIITKVNKYSNIQSVTRNEYLDAPAGTPIPMDSINTMLVWIPRFSATGDIANYNGGTKDAPGAFNITFVEKDTVAHDAFDFGGAISGFWIGKFENSSDTTCSPASNSAVGEGCNLTTIRPKILPNATSWRGASVSTFFGDMQKMTDSGNQYGFDKTKDTSIDTHMLKNNEWGAVSYLSQSIYGRCTSSKSCSEVGINNNSSYVTGYGAPAGSSTSATNGIYNTALGMDASTTGNIYGVYDMSGGTFEYVMGVYWDGTKYWSSGSTSTNSNSGFNGCLNSSCSSTLETGVSYPSNSKYYNLYTTESDYTSSVLQHGMTETSGWYGDIAFFVNGNYPWVLRGGYYSHSSTAGVFYFYRYFGSGNASYGSRVSTIIN